MNDLHAAVSLWYHSVKLICMSKRSSFVLTVKQNVSKQNKAYCMGTNLSIFSIKIFVYQRSSNDKCFNAHEQNKVQGPDD